MMRNRDIARLSLISSTDDSILSDSVHEYIISRGYEVVDAETGSIAINNGDMARPVYWVKGKSYALPTGVHLAMVTQQIKTAITNAPKEHNPKMCTAVIDGQLCGGTMVRLAVCPRCALGRMGVAATLTCDVCGAVTAEMRTK